MCDSFCFKSTARAKNGFTPTPKRIFFDWLVRPFKIVFGRMLKKYFYNKSIIKNEVWGFTLVELLLSLSIIAVLTFISMPVYQSFQVKNDLDIASTTVAQDLRRAQVLAQGVAGDSDWGVYLQIGSIVIFKGSSYAARDTTYDEIFDLPTSIVPSGLAQITFSKFSGEPHIIGTITLTSTGNEVKNIVINSKGMVQY